ncbi:MULTISPECIES: AraC family transcriptional regulator [Amycolatopsis]|uniref:HTH-type transcriptional regulator RipA n=1 Tax=Amycolatopsis dendrobii TaxID=2760662 RepID=A0A7W3VZE0_9PSEU|nr:MULTISPECIES: helix-turn-helix transcriptional regulator [Amycolatopsis]MBB1155492.1 helix-turn-helix transcriptional regulator [Amycolatopsis dendrobii]UKD54572.1 helix-turn-helix transcriptional regulator [Amycolatopsis sp. FU40]
MRNVPLSEVDALPRAVLAISTDYPPDHFLPPHRHRRAQFLYGATGAMRVGTADGTWTVPTRRAVLIPPETDHSVVMMNVTTRSLYLEPSAVPWFPRRCQTVDVSPLLRELLREAVDVAPEYPRRGRDATLISLLLHEISRCVPLPLELPWPRHEGLRALCQSFSDAPDVHDPPSRWAEELHVSERTLHRLFRAETGLSFARWRERACVLRALPLLAADLPVADVAVTLGYESPAAFTTMFSRLLGAPPRAYREP